MVHGISEKQKNKIRDGDCEQVPTAGSPGTKEKQVLLESLKGTGASQLDGIDLVHSAQQAGNPEELQASQPTGWQHSSKALMVISSLILILHWPAWPHHSGRAAAPRAAAQSLLLAHSHLGQTQRQLPVHSCLAQTEEGRARCKGVLFLQESTPGIPASPCRALGCPVYGGSGD